MKKLLLKRLVIFLAVLFACIGFVFFLSAGKPLTPDASPYRRLLYTFWTYILPVITVVNFFYLFSYFLKKPLKTILISLVLGLVGPLSLWYAIQTSKDPMAGMAIVGVVFFYAIATIVVFLMLTLFQAIRDRKQ